jgi:magnesium-protoporphyrin IX monomethyl ester (oxidative) cyclase
MKRVLAFVLLMLAGFVLVRWYRREAVVEAETTVHLQSEHEHSHLHVDHMRDEFEWIRFFRLAVYATMYLNDARRRDFYAALGLNWRDYDDQVIALCNRISTQVYPVTLPVDHPQFYKNLDACVAYDETLRQLAGRTDPLALVRAARLRAAMALRLLATYRLPPAPTTEANRWNGLAGFPNYPGPDRFERVVSA